METRTCPYCGRFIYGRNGNFTCFLCGFFQENYRTGVLERSDNEETEEREEE